MSMVLAGCILALDPSSTRTGFAVMRVSYQAVDAGYLAPRRTRDDPEQRIDAMVESLGELLAAVRPRAVVIEIPSGRPGTGSRAGARASLAIYGLAAGELRRAAKAWAKDQELASSVVSVTEQDWTGGVPKTKRRARIALLFPAYRAAMAADSGGDVSDAIGLGRWFLAAEARGMSGVSGQPKGHNHEIADS